MLLHVRALQGRVLFHCCSSFIFLATAHVRVRALAGLSPLLWISTPPRVSGRDPSLNLRLCGSTAVWSSNSVSGTSHIGTSSRCMVRSEVDRSGLCAYRLADQQRRYSQSGAIETGADGGRGGPSSDNGSGSAPAQLVLPKIVSPQASGKGIVTSARWATPRFPFPAAGTNHANQATRWRRSQTPCASRLRGFGTT